MVGGAAKDLALRGACTNPVGQVPSLGFSEEAGEGTAVWEGDLVKAAGACEAAQGGGAGEARNRFCVELEGLCGHLDFSLVAPVPNTALQNTNGIVSARSFLVTCHEGSKQAEVLPHRWKKGVCQDISFWSLWHLGIGQELS